MCGWCDTSMTKFGLNHMNTKCSKVVLLETMCCWFFLWNLHITNLILRGIWVVFALWWWLTCPAVDSQVCVLFTHILLRNHDTLCSCETDPTLVFEYLYNTIIIIGIRKHGSTVFWAQEVMIAILEKHFTDFHCKRYTIQFKNEFY